MPDRERTPDLPADKDEHPDLGAESQNDPLSQCEGTRSEIVRTIAGPRGVEQELTAEVIDWGKQYDSAVRVAKQFRIPIPTLDAVRQAFTPEQLAAVPQLREPVLLFVLTGDGKADCVQPVIVEGKQEMDMAAYDSVPKRYDERIAAARTHRPEHMDGMDQAAYAMLYTHTHHLVDRVTSTVLDDEETPDGEILLGACFGGDLRILPDRSAYEYGSNARFRLSVRGKKLPVSGV